MPFPIKDAIMVGEQDLLNASVQRLDDGGVPCSRRSAVCRQNHMLNFAAGKRVLTWTGVIHHVYVGKRRGLITNAVEQTEQTTQVPLGADVAWNDECAQHGLGRASSDTKPIGLVQPRFGGEPRL